jgi:tRNA A-37 threonylcarbamoyl transferase component Bud32
MEPSTGARSSRDRLRAVLGSGVDLDAAWAEFRRAGDDDDPMAFAVWLCGQRRMSIDQLRAYLLDGDLHLLPRPDGADADWERLALLGKGAMGHVYVARDRRLNRNVAVKEIAPAIAADPVLVRRFYTEAQITAQLDHPGIVPVYGLEVQPDGTLAYAMRIVRGRTLREVLDDLRATYAAGRPLRADQQLQSRLLLFESLCRTLQHAHERGVLHRDLKPQNVMVGPHGEVLVLDWGIAKVVGRPDTLGTAAGDGPGGPDATAIGEAIGTARYFSPEQAAGQNDALDARSDQYALGLLLFELVTLTPANPGKDADTCRTAAREGALAPFVHVRGEPLPSDLAAIVRKATARRRDDRYPDVGALAEDVRRFLRDEELLARPDALGRRALRFVGRHRRAALAAIGGLGGSLVLVIAAAVAVGAVAFTSWRWWAERREAAFARMLAEVSAQGHAIDASLAADVALVESLRAAAAFAFAHPPTETRPVYLAADFAGPGAGRPPGLVPSPVYRAPATLDHPDTVLRPGLSPADVAVRLQQLQSLQPELLRVLSVAASPALAAAPMAERRRALLEEGGPLVWAYVATEEGILTGLPGVGRYPDGWDPRQSVWYPLALGAEGVVWDVSDDESGLGLLLTGAVAIRDAEGRAWGMAAVDLTVTEVADAWLAPVGLPPARAALMDGAGRVLIDTRNPRAAAEKTPFEYPEVLADLAAGRAGGLRVVGDEVIAWTAVEQLGWTYAVVADREVVLDALAP